MTVFSSPRKLYLVLLQQNGHQLVTIAVTGYHKHGFVNAGEVCTTVLFHFCCNHCPYPIVMSNVINFENAIACARHITYINMLIQQVEMKSWQLKLVLFAVENMNSKVHFWDGSDLCFTKWV